MPKIAKLTGNATTGVKKPKKSGSKSQKASRLKDGEVAIYGGIVKCGERERNNWAFWSIWKNLNEYGNQECADEEEIPPKYRDLNHMDAALRWEDILKDATKRLWLYARTELELFDIPERDRDKVKECIVSYMNNVEQAGQEVNAIMEEFASGDFDGDKDDFVEKVMKKMYYGIYVQICWAMNTTKDCVRKVIDSNGYPLGKIGNGEEEDSALTILKLLKDGEIGKGDFKDTTIEEAKLKMLQLCPFNDEVVAYCYLDDGGKGPINDIVREAKIDIEKLNEKLPSEDIGGIGSSSQSRSNRHRRDDEKDKKNSMCEASEAADNVTKQQSAKKSKKGKSANSSKTNAGGVAIYGGIFAVSQEERNYVEYRKAFIEPMSKYLSPDESGPAFDRKMKELCSKSANYYRENWMEILNEFSEDLDSVRHNLVKAFALEERFAIELRCICKKAADAMFDYGQQFKHSFDELVNDDSVSVEEANDGCRKGAVFFMMMFGECRDSVLDTAFRDMLERAGIELREYGEYDDLNRARKIFRTLKSGGVPSGKADATKLELLRLAPNDKEYIQWCWLDDNGKGPINDIARAARVDVNPLKRELLKKIVGDADLSTESSAHDYRDRIVKAAGELELDISEDLAEIDAALKRLDCEYRTVDGREFPTRDEADKQRKLSAYEAELDLSSEESSIEAKAKLEKFIKKLGVEGAWKMERVTQALECFDKAARRAGDRIFETREEAAKQRELVDFEKSCTITDETSAIKLKSDIIAMATRLGIDGTWKLERVNRELERFDKLARTAFGIEYQTREEAAAKRDSSEAFFAAVEAAITSSNDNGFYFKDGIPPKKLVGARTYLSGVQDDGVFAIVDTTIFGSAKIGLVVSRWGVIWKNDTVETARNAYSWKELASLDTPSKPNRGEITFEKGVVFDFTNSNGDADACRDTLVKLVAFAKESTSLDRLSTVKTDGQSAGTPDIAEFAKFPCSCLFVEGGIPEKKLRNAFVSMKVREPIDSVRFLIDSTVFGSAKEGMLVTNDAVYFKNFMEDPVRVPFESIESVEAQKNAITINSKVCQLINIPVDSLEKICSYINVVSKTRRR